MDPLSPKNLISTNDASKLSGYSADYLARLGKSGKIRATRVGRNWFLDRASFQEFVEKQGDRKEAYAHALARVREVEYRNATSPVRQAVRTLTSPIPLPTFALAPSVKGELVAVLVALLIVGGASVFAGTSSIPNFASHVGGLLHETREGFIALLGEVTSPIATRVDSVRLFAARISSDARETLARNFDAMAIPIARTPDVLILALTLPNIDAVTVPAPPTQRGSVAASPFSLPTRSDLAGIPRRAFSFIGELGLSFGTEVRDVFARTPEAMTATYLAFGNTIIVATNFAIHADTLLAYGVANVAPKSAEIVVTAIGEGGAMIASFAATAPRQIATAFRAGVAAWGDTALRLAAAGFKVEYSLAEQFVTGARALLALDASVIKRAGTLVYESAASGARLAGAGAAFVSTFGAAVEDRALMFAGNVALLGDRLFETISRPLARLTDEGLDALAAVAASALPSGALSTGERTALATYKAGRSFFTYTSDALALFFEPRPQVV